MNFFNTHNKLDLEGGNLIMVDKPLDWTSFDVVNKIRSTIKWTFNRKKIKVGHAGTLDPKATGLLIVAIGPYTKKLAFLQELDKQYEGTIKFGATTPTYDSEAEEDQQFSLEDLSMDDIREVSQSFHGWIDQKPPAFSAVKIKGVASYIHARKGNEVELKSRKVCIQALSLTEYEWPYVDFVLDCSKGTYVRSLAHDLGVACNNGAYLTRLRRNKIGQYHIENAWNLEELITAIKAYQDRGHQDVS